MLLQRVNAGWKIVITTVILFILIYIDNLGAYIDVFVIFFVLLLLSSVKVRTILKIFLYPLLAVIFYLVMMYMLDAKTQPGIDILGLHITDAVITAGTLMIAKVYTFTILSCTVILTTKMSDIVNFFSYVCHKMHLDKFNIDVILNVAIIYVNLLITEFQKAITVRNIRIHGNDNLIKKFKDYCGILVQTIKNATAKTNNMAIALTFRRK